MKNLSVTYIYHLHVLTYTLMDIQTVASDKRIIESACEYSEYANIKRQRKRKIQRWFSFTTNKN